MHFNQNKKQDCKLAKYPEIYHSICIILLILVSNKSPGFLLKWAHRPFPASCRQIVSTTLLPRLSFADPHRVSNSGLRPPTHANTLVNKLSRTCCTADAQKLRAVWLQHQPAVSQSWDAKNEQGSWKERRDRLKLWELIRAGKWQRPHDWTSKYLSRYVSRYQIHTSSA